MTISFLILSSLPYIIILSSSFNIRNNDYLWKFVRNRVITSEQIICLPLCLCLCQVCTGQCTSFSHLSNFYISIKIGLILYHTAFVLFIVLQESCWNSVANRMVISSGCTVCQLFCTSRAGLSCSNFSRGKYWV